MPEHVDIRDGGPADTAAIEALYPQAFPDEDLLPLVRDLLRASDMVRSLVATDDGRIVGHAALTDCGVAGSEARVALLGPVAVAPPAQGRGIGSALIRAGLRAVEAAGARRVFVLGDPAYYGRFGFRPECGVAPPYPLPAEWAGAWQSLAPAGAPPPVAGDLCVPRPWRQRSLWTP